MQKRLKEAFEVARRLTYEEATKQRCYYDRRAGAVTLQPGDVVMVRTDGFVGKRKVKDRWEDGVSSLSLSWETGLFTRFGVHLLMTDRTQNLILHRNRLLLSPMRTSMTPLGQAQAKATPTLPNATHEALSVGVALKSPYLPW